MLPPTLSRHVHTQHIPTLGTLEEVVPDLPIKATTEGEVLKALAFDVAGAERHVFILSPDMQAWLRQELAEGPVVALPSADEIARVTSK